MTTLIIAEHDNKTLNLATLHSVSAAEKLNQEIHVFLAGLNCQHIADQVANIAGVDRVIVADNQVYQHQLAENISQVAAELAKNYSHIISTATAVGKNLMPRIAALLGVAQLSEVIKIKDDETFSRAIYAGNAIATVKSLDSKKVMTIRATAFDPANTTGGNASIVTINNIFENTECFFVADELGHSDRPELTSASVIVSGGRGMANGENFALLEKLADKLGGAVGASRAAVDSGFVANDMQIGQTGKIVAPDLYIAVGISGAIQHLAGMKDSKVIVAINNDEDAPIFQVADYGLVADLFDVLPELTEKL